MPTSDADDPCAVATELRAAYRRLISGSQETSFEYSGNGVTRRADYARADLTALRDEIRDQEAKCSASLGLEPPRRRFAIQGGGRFG